MKTIINVFKNLKTIESKPKRVLIGLSTALLIPEIVWSIGLIIYLFLELMSYLDRMNYIKDIDPSIGFFVAQYGWPIIGPSAFFYPYFGIISFLMTLFDLIILNRSKSKFDSKQLVIVHTILTSLNPSLFIFLLIVCLFFC